MSKLNDKNVKTAKNAVSHNGNPQFLKNIHERLIEFSVGMVYGKDNFYETFDEQTREMMKIISTLTKGNEKDLNYLANVILFVRKTVGLRTLPVVMTIQMAYYMRVNNINWAGMRSLVTAVLSRVDDITEMFAYAEKVFTTKNAIPLAIKKGIADAFLKFDEYQLQKYNNQGRAKRLKDIMQVVHPKPRSEDQSNMFKRLLEDKLETPYTWETQLSANGQLPVSERKTEFQLWYELVTSKRLPYQALLRNLRNIEQAIESVSSNTEKSALANEVVKQLTTRETLAKLQMFPWSFIKAYDSVTSFAFKKAINDAAEMSIEYMPKLGDNVWIILDESGSMEGTPIQHASNLTAALIKSVEKHNTFNLKVTCFSNGARDFKYAPSTGFITQANNIVKFARGGGTNLGAALHEYQNLGFEPDCVIVLSDMQVNELDGYNNQLLRTIEKKTPRLLAFNLQGYASTPLRTGQGWIQFSGWSDKVFKYIDLEQNKGFAQNLYENPIYSF